MRVGELDKYRAVVLVCGHGAIDPSAGLFGQGYPGGEPPIRSVEGIDFAFLARPGQGLSAEKLNLFLVNVDNACRQGKSERLENALFNVNVEPPPLLTHVMGGRRWVSAITRAALPVSEREKTARKLDIEKFKSKSQLHRSPKASESAIWGHPGSSMYGDVEPFTGKVEWWRDLPLHKISNDKYCVNTNDDRLSLRWRIAKLRSARAKTQSPSPSHQQLDELDDAMKAAVSQMLQGASATGSTGSVEGIPVPSALPDDGKLLKSHRREHVPYPSRFKKSSLKQNLRRGREMGTPSDILPAFIQLYPPSIVPRQTACGFYTLAYICVSIRRILPHGNLLVVWCCCRKYEHGRIAEDSYWVNPIPNSDKGIIADPEVLKSLIDGKHVVGRKASIMQPYSDLLELSEF